MCEDDLLLGDITIFETLAFPPLFGDEDDLLLGDTTYLRPRRWSGRLCSTARGAKIQNFRNINFRKWALYLSCFDVANLVAPESRIMVLGGP